MTNGKKKLLGMALSAMLAAGIFTGCGGQQGTPGKAMEVLKQDTPLTSDTRGRFGVGHYVLHYATIPVMIVR